MDNALLSAGNRLRQEKGWIVTLALAPGISRSSPCLLDCISRGFDSINSIRGSDLQIYLYLVTHIYIHVPCVPERAAGS